MSTVINVSLRKQIYEYLREQMNQGKLKPGKMINQRELSNQLKVSRTPLRDTMIQLEAEGFLEIVPYKGVFIRKLTMRDIQDYFEMGGVLEGKACVLALPHFTEKDLQEMDQLIAETIVQCERNDFSISNEQNKRFNDIILDRCPNRKIAENLTVIREKLYHFPRQDPSSAAKRELGIWMEHKVIRELISLKDEEALNNYIVKVHWRIDEEYIQQRFHCEEVKY